MISSHPCNILECVGKVLNYLKGYEVAGGVGG